jgi:hypothetical protein
MHAKVHKSPRALAALVIPYCVTQSGSDRKVMHCSTAGGMGLRQENTQLYILAE